MIDLTTKVVEYDGVLAISDIHGEAMMLSRAIRFATEHNLYIVFLGDLIDGGDMNEGAVNLVLHYLDEDLASLVIGNHEEKMYRFVKGNPVTLGTSAQKTIDFFAPHITRHRWFRENIAKVVTHRNAAHALFMGSTIFAHGAVHPTLWDFPYELNSTQKRTSLYGVVDGTLLPNGAPKRFYEWVDEIPDGGAAVVGHDRVALGKSATAPSVVKNLKGGKAFFTDTSAGKQDDGYITGAIDHL